MIHRNFFVTGCAALSALAQPALAQTSPIVVEAEPPVEIVSYAGLDLSNPSGVNRLNGRVRNAARRLCAGQVGHSTWRAYEVNACLERSVADARSQIDRAIARYGHTEMAQRPSITVAGR